MHRFAKVYKAVIALDLWQNFVSTQYLKNKLMELTKFCIYIDIGKTYVEIVIHEFVMQIYTRVMVLNSY